MTDNNTQPTADLYAVEQKMREAMAASPTPAGLHGQILRALALEKRRARLMAIYRRVGVVAATVLLLVPAVTLPILQLGREAAVPEAADAHTVSATKDVLAVQNSTELLDASGGVPEAVPDVELTVDTGASDTPAGETDNTWEASTPNDALPPPSYVVSPTMGSMSPSGETSALATMTTTEETSAAPAETGTADTSHEVPAYYAVLRELVGEEAFALWLASYEGDPTTAAAEAAAYAYFGLDE